MKITGKFTKRDDDKFLVFGVASAADVVDSQGDVITADDLEKAAYDFVRFSGEGCEMHRKWGVARLIESFFVTADKAEMLGVNKDFIGKWFVGFKVNDAETWQKIKNGDLSMFSIGGRAVREVLADESA